MICTAPIVSVSLLSSELKIDAVSVTLLQSDLAISNVSVSEICE